MKHHIQLTMILFIIFSCGLAYAGTVTINYGTGTATQMQSTSGSTTNQAVAPVIANPVVANPDTFTTSPPLIESAPAPTSTTTEQPAPSGTTAAPPAEIAGVGIGAGLNVILSEHVKGFSLPLSYKFTPNLRMSVNIPYISKTLTGEFTGEELTTSGLGDIFTNIGYRYGDEATFVQGITYFGVSLPTGASKQFEGRREVLPLGTGSYDFTINQTASKLLGNFRLIGSLGYRYNTKSDYTETDNYGRNVKFENKNGNMFTYFAGVDYRTPVRGLLVYCNLSGLIIARSHLKQTDVSDGTIINDGERADRLKTLDITPGVKLIITKNISIRLGVTIPAWTQYDSNVVNPVPRDLTFDFGMAGMF